MLHLVLVSGVLTVVVLLLVHAEIHKRFNGLLALWRLRLHLVKGIVEDVAIVTAELAHLAKVDVDHLTLG